MRGGRLLEQPPDFWNSRHFWSKALGKGRGSKLNKEGFHLSWALLVGKFNRTRGRNFKRWGV
jgi:hypothetical protein